MREREYIHTYFHFSLYLVIHYGILIMLIHSRNL